MIIIVPVILLAYYYDRKMQNKISRILNVGLVSLFTIYYLNTYFCLPSKSYNGSKKSIRKCKICKQIKLKRSHHCSKCNRCFFMMDHHCILLNTCIGLQNYKGYLQSLVSLQLLLFNIIGYKVNKIQQLDKSQILQLLIQLSCGIDQYVGIDLNQTAVQSYKLQAGDHISFLQSLKRRIGINPLLWISPYPRYTGQAQPWMQGQQINQSQQLQFYS